MSVQTRLRCLPVDFRGSPGFLLPNPTALPLPPTKSQIISYYEDSGVGGRESRGNQQEGTANMFVHSGNHLGALTRLFCDSYLSILSPSTKNTQGKNPILSHRWTLEAWIIAMKNRNQNLSFLNQLRISRLKRCFWPFWKSFPRKKWELRKKLSTII